MCGRVNEDVSEAYRAEVSPERRVTDAYTVLYYTTLQKKRLPV